MDIVMLTCAKNIGALHIQGFRQTIPCMRTKPWSARATLFALPKRLTPLMRRERFERIRLRCEHTSDGCWLYPAVRNNDDPFIDVQNDAGKREQWSARRFVWALVNGDIPLDGVLHRGCSKNNCVFPGHQRLWAPKPIAGPGIHRPQYVTVISREHGLWQRRSLDGFERIEAPKDIYPLDILRTVGAAEIPETSGIYFLWHGPQLLYVGQSSNLSNRIYSHSRAAGARHGLVKQIPFARCTFITCPEGYRFELETKYIRAYRPPYNDCVPGI